MPTRHLAPTIGGAFALASLPLHVWLTRGASIELAAVSLAAIGAVYAGFGLQGGTRRQAGGEVAVALAFVAVSLTGLWVSPWAIPAAFAAHGFWDLAHHDHATLVAVPRWYPPFCAVYDCIFAAGLTIVWQR